jgi:hypothetical protein
MGTIGAGVTMVSGTLIKLSCKKCFNPLLIGRVSPIVLSFSSGITSPRTYFSPQVTSSAILESYKHLTFCKAHKSQHAP